MGLEELNSLSCTVEDNAGARWKIDCACVMGRLRCSHRGRLTRLGFDSPEDLLVRVFTVTILFPLPTAATVVLGGYYQPIVPRGLLRAELASMFPGRSLPELHAGLNRIQERIDEVLGK